MAPPCRRPRVGEEVTPAGKSSKWNPDLLAGATQYTTERYTQSLGRATDGEYLVHQWGLARLPARWRLSGGMEGINASLWRSHKYRFIPGRTAESISAFAIDGQRWWGLARTYPDGTAFHDVLSNVKTGLVFEHRKREKIRGVWQAEVLFRDRSQRPEGYGGLTVACASCHDQAGERLSGTLLLSGGDTVFSDPLPWHLLRR